MFFKFKMKRVLAGVMCLLLLLTVVPVNAFAATWQELISYLTITDSTGNPITPTYGVTQPFKPYADKASTNKPISWNNFITVMSKTYKFDQNLLLKYVKGSKDLVMTKDEVVTALKLIVEVDNGQSLNITSTARLKDLVNTLEPTRNYLLTNSLDYLGGVQLDVSTEGDLIETFYTKVLKISGDNVEVLRIGFNNYMTLETLFLNTNKAWKKEPKIYEIKTIGKNIQGIESKYNIKYGVVNVIGNNYYIDNTKLNSSYDTLNADDLVEYVNMNSKLVVTKNFGQYDGSYIVKDKNKKYIETYEGKEIDDDYTLVTLDGKEVDYDDIKENDVLTKFSDYLVVNNKQTSSSDIRYSGGKLYIDNVEYDAKTTLATDGDTVSYVNDFTNFADVEDAKIVWDAVGNPKLVTIDKIEYFVYVTDIDDDEITGVSNDGTFNSELSWGYKGEKISRKLFRLIVIDDMIVDGEKLDMIDGRTKTIEEDYLKFDGVEYFINPKTLVVVEKLDEDEDVEDYDDMEYSDFVDYHENTLNDASVSIEIYFEEDDEYSDEDEDNERNDFVKVIKIIIPDEE